MINMKADRRNQAIKNSIRQVNLNYGSDISLHRRNLLLASVIGFVTILISPTEGAYSVNLGVISGEVKEPIYIYLGVLFFCAYQTLYFWYRNRRAVSDLFNREKIEEVYIFELAKILAFDYWNNLSDGHRVAGNNTAIGSFNRSPVNNKAGARYYVRAVTQSGHIEELKGLDEVLRNDPRLQISESRGFYNIDYEFEPSEKDYMYLSVHRNMFWILKISDFIEQFFPLLLGFSAILGVIYKVMIMI